GAVKLRGFYDVETNGEGIFANLPGRVTVWQSHYEEVKELPREFEITASSETCRIEAMRHRSRPLFTVQFHPELFDEEHPQGKIILENFLNL
nr:gamma-glutamyl-gamma-aminobutyrate hydrolase family protein [Acidobacteriota bacterium]